MTRAAIPQPEPREQAARDSITAAYIPIGDGPPPPPWPRATTIIVALSGLLWAIGILALSFARWPS